MVMVVRITSIIKITDAGIRISYFDGSIRVNRNDPNPINKVAIVPAIYIVLLALLSNIDLISISLLYWVFISSRNSSSVIFLLTLLLNKRFPSLCEVNVRRYRPA